MTKVKVCGLTSAADARAAAEAGADLLGFVFAPSPRRLDPELARGFWEDLPPKLPRVGVFRDQTIGEIERVLALLPLDFLQFHGAERPGFCRYFGRPVIRAISAGDPLALASAEAWADVAMYFLVDLPKEAAAGVLADEVARAAAALPRPVFLAGGLDPGNVGAFVARHRPFGVDVARGVEASPGRKDHGKLRAFVRAAKGA